MESGALSPPSRFRITPELWLGLAGLLSLAVAAIHINTVLSGLPAHPLFLHVPVMLIPLMGIAGLVLAVRPRLFGAHGLWIGFVTALTLASLNLTMSAGESLRHQLGLEGRATATARLVSDHSHAADQLRIAFVLFTAVMIVAVALSRHERGKRIGIGLFDGLLGWASRRLNGMLVLRIAMALLAVASLYTVFHTGDLGAKTVWLNRHAAGPPPGF